MAKNPFDLSPDFLAALRAAQEFRLAPDIDRLARESTRLAESHLATMKALATGFDMLGYSETLQAIEGSQFTYASQLARLHETAESVARFADRFGLASGSQFAAFHPTWLDKAGETATLLSRSVQEIIDHHSAWTRMAEASLARIEMLQLDTSFAAAGHLRGTVASIKGLTDSLASIYAENLQTLPALPKLVVERPPQEVFVHFRAVEIIGGEGIEDAEIEEETDTLWVDTETALPEMLARRFGSELVGKWHGAREALASGNPDRIAHVSVSIRELFRIVLHAVAPDSAIREWSTSKDDFDKGRPTRRARFRYATRSIDHPPFSRFLGKDFSTALELLTIFDEGVHAPKSHLTEKQLRIMVLRMGQFLRLLIEAADEP